MENHDDLVSNEIFSIIPVQYVLNLDSISRFSIFESNYVVTWIMSVYSVFDDDENLSLKPKVKLFWFGGGHRLVVVILNGFEQIFVIDDVDDDEELDDELKFETIDDDRDDDLLVVDIPVCLLVNVTTISPTIKRRQFNP
ncbi:hypothetical protein DERP_010630 [Dermatophagoides pteronyssinus]|uniref:Uncharacterized protein n=1 Tax=Dermatophagoides pteronyssinus TaxID=6956 RepID=A0ABQ8JAK2_DERPT|nr:hypothetical protein DERP_010630 [Dermatophagoides pteronyssinus]